MKSSRTDAVPAGGANSQGKLLFGSDPVEHRVVRRRVKEALRRGLEPVPKYREGKSWRD